MIIDVGKNRSRVARITDLGTTTLAWLAFGWLAIRGIVEMRAGEDLAPVPLHVAIAEALNSVSLYLAIALANAAALLGWALYNQVRFGARDRRKAAGGRQTSSLPSAHSGLEPALLQTLQTGGRMILHHDGGGRIVGAELVRSI